MITTKNQRGSVHRRPLTKTQKNGLRQKQAEADWKDLLEMRSYAPIKDQRVRRNTAMLLENQWNHLTEAATNTSIFGPANGVTGGALSATDSYATGDNRLPRVLLPMVRRIYPALMSNETVGVQPMPGPVALAFAIRYRYLRGANAAGDSSVNHRHDSATSDPHGIKGIETKSLVKGRALAEGEQLVVSKHGKFVKTVTVAENDTVATLAATLLDGETLQDVLEVTLIDGQLNNVNPAIPYPASV